MRYLRGHDPQNERKKQQGSVFLYSHIICSGYLIVTMTGFM